MHGYLLTRFCKMLHTRKPNVCSSSVIIATTQVLTNADLGLQVLDNVIMTRWKVLPKEQCQGKSLKMASLGVVLTETRNSEFRGQLHHTMFRLRRIFENPEDPSEQVEPRPCVYSQARVAS